MEIRLENGQSSGQWTVTKLRRKQARSGDYLLISGDQHTVLQSTVTRSYQSDFQSDFQFDFKGISNVTSEVWTDPMVWQSKCCRFNRTKARKSLSKN